MRVLLIGTSQMAVDHARVLTALGVRYDVVGRSPERSAWFAERTGVAAMPGGVERHFAENDSAYTHAIVAAGVEDLTSVTRAAIENGVGQILAEKPGGLSVKELSDTAKLAARHRAEVYIAYNRRFYATTRKAAQIIEDDGGILSFSFEFTEWASVWRAMEASETKKNSALLSNSSHVMDLAFSLGGKPKELSCYSGGENDWNDTPAIYAGAGTTDKGAFFSYSANWNAPGRWGVEWLTAKHRLILRPLEKLQIQNIGSVEINEYLLEDTLDTDYKPGLYRQAEAFLGLSRSGSDRNSLIGIGEQAKMAAIYDQIREGGYKD
jgi:predicted dehydrogenase